LFNMVTRNMTENSTNDMLTDLYNEPVYIASCVAITAAVEVIGNGLLVVIIMYEKFGMDPQKRTTINQLLSKVCWMLIMRNMTNFPFLVGRTLFGPQSELVAMWMLYGMTFSVEYIWLTLTEMIILKCLYLFYWPRMAMLDDTFVAQFLGHFNLMIASICTLSRLHLGEYHNNTHFHFFTGTNSFEDDGDLSNNIRFM
jgi:hypothetical protein